AGRRRTVIARELLSAATSRGAALINRIKADPSLANAEIRVVSLDGTYRVSPPRTPAAPGDTPSATVPALPAPDVADAQLEVVAPPSEGAATQNLDYRGTRR